MKIDIRGKKNDDTSCNTLFHSPIIQLYYGSDSKYPLFPLNSN